jgi:hypothetical protein
MSEDGHRITEAMLVEAIGALLGLEKCEAESRVAVKEFTVTEGSNKGDNFACVMKVSTYMCHVCHMCHICHTCRMTLI